MGVIWAKYRSRMPTLGFASLAAPTVAMLDAGPDEADELPRLPKTDPLLCTPDDTGTLGVPTAWV